MDRSIQTKVVYSDAAQIAMAFVAFMVIQTFRLTYFASPVILCVESVFFLTLPVLLLWLLRHRLNDVLFDKAKEQNALILFTVLQTTLTVATQIVLRQYGHGDSYEIVAITTMLNVTWGFAVFSSVFRLERVVFLLCSSMVLFVCFTTQAVIVFIASACYAFVALKWMLDSYWRRLQTKALDAESKLLPIRGVVLVGSCFFLLVIGVLASFAGPLRQTISLPGFMPSSGGTDGTSDIYSRSGIGDGDRLTNGENATSVGAVETDQFIEDDKPSMYDIMSDTYDGPKVKKSERSKAVSPDAIAKHLHDVKRSEQAGKSLRTLREAGEEHDRELDDRISNALFYVEGPVPTRFAVDYFQHFDGWDWSKTSLPSSETKSPKIQLEFHHDRPWYTVNHSNAELMANVQHHKVKLMRLSTKNLPSPPFLTAWHIDRVDRQSFFKRNQFGAIDLGGSEFPSLIVINTISKTPNFDNWRVAAPLASRDEIRFFERLGRWFDSSSGSRPMQHQFCRSAAHKDSSFLQVAENSTKARIQSLVEKWTSGKPKGWTQIQTIVDEIRNGYELDRSRVADASSTDSVASFLDNDGGPPYLFATTAAQVLRAAGYETRLASGFVVRKEDFVRVSNQSIVDSANYHVWPEVRLGESLWIPVEPTPGYPDPTRKRSFWEEFTTSTIAVIHWIASRPVSSLAVLGSIILIIAYRKIIVSMTFWFFWLCVFFLKSEWRLRATRQLLDLRFWAAGLPRPAFVPIQRWFEQVGTEECYDFFSYWNRAQFSTCKESSIDRKSVEQACRAIVAGFSLIRIKNFVKRNDTQKSDQR